MKQEYNEVSPSMETMITGIGDYFSEKKEQIDQLIQAEKFLEARNAFNFRLDVVKENVQNYLAENLPNYQVKDVCQMSKHSDDWYLYKVVGIHENGDYATWTYNLSTDSLNGGCYELSAREVGHQLIKQTVTFNEILESKLAIMNSKTKSINSKNDFDVER